MNILDSLTLPLAPGALVLILGPSGAGKSSVLSEIERRIPTACAVHRVDFPLESSIIDQIAPHKPLADAAQLLAACGLGDSRLWLRTYDSLSEGERFRARLACALARHGDVRAPGFLEVPSNASSGAQRGLYPHTNAVSAASPGFSPLLCDEFAGSLHRRAARAVAFNLRKLVTRGNLCMVLAAHHDEVVSDLQPDIVVRLRGQGRASVEHGRVRADRAFSLRRTLDIVVGGKRDYEAFARMHYRDTDELGFVDRVYLLRERGDGDVLGIVVYAHAPLELALRNRATGGWFSRNAARVNRHLRILRRLVIHPDVRGCGLGRHLVRATMPLLGTRFVECLAAMGEHNPVFERAGMTRIGQYEVGPDRAAVLADLRDMGVDPCGGEFAEEVARRPALRRLVAKTVHDWYAATTGGGDARVERQSLETLARTFRGVVASRPVYYLWKRRDAKPADSKSAPPRHDKPRSRISMNPSKRPSVREPISDSIRASTRAASRRKSGRTSPRRARRRNDRHNPFK